MVGESKKKSSKDNECDLQGSQEEEDVLNSFNIHRNFFRNNSPEVGPTTGMHL